MGKHVIFLGAGASSASCYPLASELRLLLSSEHHFESWMWKCFPGNREAVDLAKNYFSTFKRCVLLFHEGAFASVDEFCRLVSGKGRGDEVAQMRFLTRAALGALNPEAEFDTLGNYPFIKSEYYPLVQNLFSHDLATLRQDVSVLDFNYDPCLEFLLWRAWSIRNGGQLPDSDTANSMTSGFHNLQDGAWAASDQSRLYLLKLHGSICNMVAGRGISFKSLFENPPKERAAALFNPGNVGIPIPIIFPWEILGEDLKFSKTNFPLGNYQGYFEFFVSIWERARKEVFAADKVSFVGLSMHKYLELGFRYLFQVKEGPVEVVVANPLNERFREDRNRNRLSPNSPCKRVGDLIAEVSNRRVLCRYSKRDTVNANFARENTDQCVTPRYSFADFIEHEL
jgi:hypothetical protein